MTNAQQRFNCPRRMVALVNAEDVWLNSRWSRPDDLWPDNTAKPRTCSYCGGVNPDDVIPLLIAGWHVEPTDKGYKFYLSSPAHLSAVPPVKVYLQHWTQEQVQRADDVLRARAQMDETRKRDD